MTGGWRQLWHLLYGDHHILNTDDTAGYDLTFDGAAHLNDMLADLNGSTFYFSLPCSWTSQPSSWLMPKDRPVPLPTNTASLIPLGALIASRTPQAIPSDCTQVSFIPDLVGVSDIFYFSARRRGRGSPGDGGAGSVLY